MNQNERSMNQSRRSMNQPCESMIQNETSMNQTSFYEPKQRVYDSKEHPMNQTLFYNKKEHDVIKSCSFSCLFILRTYHFQRHLNHIIECCLAFFC
jgi:hypothetical protein